MKNNFLNSFILLVIINLKLTHANLNSETLKNFNKNDDNSLKKISIKNYEEENIFKDNRKSHQIVKRDIPGPSSVVQDWNLVCSELCGAGLGGPVCGPQCKTDLRTINQTQVKDLLGHNNNLICSVLCASRLGDPLCMCPQLQIQEQSHVTLEHNIICSSFCDHNNVTLTGCSPCLTSSSSNDDNLNERKPRSNNDFSSNISTTTTSNIPSVQLTKTTITTLIDKTTTPDWHKLCKELCKTGDGGALCNCDLPPFF